MTVTVEPPPLEDIDAGVIEEARAHQRRQRCIAGITIIAAAGFAALGLGLAGGFGSPHPAQGLSSHRPPSKAAPVSLASASCRIPPTAGGTVQGPPSKSLLSILGVLRRPATAADALPAAMERSLLAPRLGQAVTLFVNYIRRARVVGAVTYWVFPEILTYCGGKLGAKQTRQSLELAATVGYFGVPGDYLTGGGTAAKIEKAGSVSSTDGPSSSQITMLVPDKVATVKLHYPAGPVGGSGAPTPGFSDYHHVPAVTVTAKVVGNLVAVTVPRGNNRSYTPVTMTWLSASGTTIKKFSAL
jgi:hypothetical protein